MFIIGITGKLHSGKDTVAKYLLEKIPNSTKRSFADPLKEIGINIFGFTEAQMYDQKEKEVIDSFWNTTGRKWCQDFGTILREHYRNDVWISIMEKYIKDRVSKDYSVLIIPDVRYDNEADFILKNNGVIIKVTRVEDNKVEDSVREHSSEKGISFGKISTFIDNSGDFSNLYSQLDKLLAEFEFPITNAAYDDLSNGDTIFNNITGRYETVDHVENGFVFTKEIAPEGTALKDIKRTKIIPFSYNELRSSYLGEPLLDKKSDRVALITEISEDNILVGGKLHSHLEAAKSYTFPDGSPFGKIEINSR